ncbi:hypothetical protein BKA82DRAFT_26056 [Pisolithus tinctorius]|uniref:SAP domain-containing protein n=1 Tax=Pisolithus tinctorius Marx 270 TaxID=870435 RepID=A0A0C3K4T6_PISTI|nr:hypothetical protein BKA82DRAFT_26056 [Pisolithus tinctorius]KIO04592.1 hypothetical protein M404DRAFT_26056 [Pisolithus tinctorius Marx 270]
MATPSTVPSSPSSSSNVTLPELPALGIVLGISIFISLIICYKVYSQVLLDFSPIVLKICAWICPPRKGLYDPSVQESFFCIEAEQLDHQAVAMVSHPTKAQSAAELKLATMWDTSEAQSTAKLSARAANTSVDGHGPCSLQSCEGVLLFPTHQFSCNRQPEVEHININVMTAKELKALCRKLGLSQTGTKQVLLERLEAFSQDHNAWQW